MHIKIAARNSKLSRIQVVEFISLLKSYYPNCTYKLHAVDTIGDIDQQTSLKEMDKTNFFTKEIDQLVVDGKVDIGVHSAKDLPDPILEELEIYAITKGVDPSDSLVFRECKSVKDLPIGAKIASSSFRRDQVIQSLRKDLCCVDVRGTIEQRLEKLEKKQFDAIVIAEAALIRLNLTHLHRIKLPGETTPMQGQLAVVGTKQNEKLKSIINKLDHRPKTCAAALNV